MFELNLHEEHRRYLDGCIQGWISKISGLGGRFNRLYTGVGTSIGCEIPGSLRSTQRMCFCELFPYLTSEEQEFIKTSFAKRMSYDPRLIPFSSAHMISYLLPTSVCSSFTRYEGQSTNLQHLALSALVIPLKY